MACPFSIPKPFFFFRGRGEGCGEPEGAGAVLVEQHSLGRVPGDKDKLSDPEGDYPTVEDKPWLATQTHFNHAFSCRINIDEFGEPVIRQSPHEPGCFMYPLITAEDILEPEILAQRRVRVCVCPVSSCILQHFDLAENHTLWTVPYIVFLNQVSFAQTT